MYSWGSTRGWAAAGPFGAASPADRDAPPSRQLRLPLPGSRRDDAAAAAAAAGMVACWQQGRSPQKKPARNTAESRARAAFIASERLPRSKAPARSAQPPRSAPTASSSASSPARRSSLLPSAARRPQRERPEPGRDTPPLLGHTPSLVAVTPPAQKGNSGVGVRRSWTLGRRTSRASDEGANRCGRKSSVPFPNAQPTHFLVKTRSTPVYTRQMSTANTLGRRNTTDGSQLWEWARVLLF